MCKLKVQSKLETDNNDKRVTCQRFCISFHVHMNGCVFYIGSPSPVRILYLHQDLGDHHFLNNTGGVPKENTEKWFSPLIFWPLRLVQLNKNELGQTRYFNEKWQGQCHSLKESRRRGARLSVDRCCVHNRIFIFKSQLQ